MKYLLLTLLFLLPACAHLRDAFEEHARLHALRGKPTARARAMAHHMAAEIHERQGRFEMALDESRAAARLAPEAEPLQMRLIAACLRMQEFEEARKLARRVAAANPDNYMAWVWLGVIPQHLDEFDDAAAALKRAIEIDPENALGYEALAAVQEETNDWIGAIDLYARLLEMAPQSPALHYQLGLGYLRIGQAERAETHLRRAIAFNPVFPHAHFLAGLAAFDQERFDQAEAAFRRTLALAPTDRDAAANMAAALARQGRLDGALELLRLLASQDDYDPAHVLFRDFALLATQEPLRDIAPPLHADLPYWAALLEAARLQPEANPGPAFRTFRNLQGDLEEELRDYVGSLIRFFGEDAVGRTLVAPLERLFETHGDASPPVLRLALARLLIALERDAQAAHTLDTLVDQNQAGMLGHYYLAIIHEAAGDVETAELHAKRALELDTDNPDLMNFLGYMYAENSMKLDEAERLLERALELDPNNGFYLDSLGWVYYRQGRAEKAIAYIRRAIRAMEADDAELRSHLGDAYLLNGELDKALREWERAYRLEPDREEIREKIERHRPTHP